MVTLHPSLSSIDPFSVTLSHPTPPSYVVFLSLALACAVVVLVCTHSHFYPRPILRPLYRATQHIHVFQKFGPITLGEGSKTYYPPDLRHWCPVLFNKNNNMFNKHNNNTFHKHNNNMLNKHNNMFMKT